ncbi:MAG: PsbP-domain-containing protein [Monoraphidium minutum]|nr:MAG: PsbP-domain-containing protein [Monoraphidium minutum]
MSSTQITQRSPRTRAAPFASPKPRVRCCSCNARTSHAAAHAVPVDAAPCSADGASSSGWSSARGWSAAAAACAAAAVLTSPWGAAAAEELAPFVNPAQQYSLSVPRDWERKEKAGADILFEDPARRSTNVGVTVSPVRVESIDKFGSLGAVGARLLETEAKKDSTLDVKLVSEAQRSGSGGALLYDYEYELSSTRGRKRIVNTVSITGSRLFILNGQFKCDKEACGDDADTQGALDTLRRVAASFDAGAGAAP